MEQNASDPSCKGILGMYIGETSRSLIESCAEHFSDGESFSKKSHMIKHWMTSHEDLNSLPPFKISMSIYRKARLVREETD